MLGSIKPYSRQVRHWVPDLMLQVCSYVLLKLVLSTGKSDWEKDIADARGSLAAYVETVRGEVPKTKSKKAPRNGPGSAPPGIYDSSEASKVTILNGSHVTVCDDTARETVLVFPDYKVVTEVDRSEEGARKLLQSLGHSDSGDSLKTWVLPYSCVILLCMCSAILGAPARHLSKYRLQVRISGGTNVALSPPQSLRKVCP